MDDALWIVFSVNSEMREQGGSLKSNPISQQGHSFAAGDVF